MSFFKRIKWQEYVLAGILVLAFFLNFWNLAKEGYSNEYYAAAVKSMLQNPAAFFFGSLDTGLYVTVDKPPLGLWIQALSAKIFGVNAFGLIFPSALAGCLCVLLVYMIVKKAWGPTAGVIAAGIMATTPVLIALSRTNNLDVLLLFVLLCGAKFMLDASKKQSLPLYLLAMFFVGLGFNIKMMQAFLVLPAFLLIYFLGKGKLGKKLLHTGIAMCVLAVVSLSWAIAVDSIPASERPYIGSSGTNSVIELALGYNGLSRLNGQQGGAAGGGPGNIPMQGGRLMPGQYGVQLPGGTPPAMPDGSNNFNNMALDRAGGGSMGRGGPGGEEESGARGILRLYSAQLSGLVSWFLLPAAGVAVFAGAGAIYWIRKRKSLHFTQEQRQKITHIVFWSAWLLPMGMFFSIGGFIHRYYVVMLCPAIGALTAIAAALAYKSKYKKWLVPLCFLLSLAMQCIIVSRTSWLWLLIPMLVSGAAGMVFFTFREKVMQTVAAVLTAAALFTAPLAWSLTPVFNTINATIPNAGPDAQGGASGGNAPGRGMMGGTALKDYLLAHYNGERWAVAVSSANEAASIILETGLPVMAVGGFSGSDSILTLEQLQKYVASGQLKYYAISGTGRGSSGITQWVQENAKAVDLGNGQTLYDLSQTSTD
ncbi:MAG: ArnT family glycosyltransferase [Bacillota bacterium]